MTDNLTVGHGVGLGAAAPSRIPLLELGEKLQFVKSKPILIGLCSRAMGSGKSAVANRLVQQHEFVLLKFAGPLKAMTRSLLAELGEDTAMIERRVEGDLKEAEIPAFQRSCRYLMQRLGTEFGRDCIHPDVWADVVRARAEKLLASGKSVVIDDMRYSNELAAVRTAGGIGVRVVRPGAEVTSAHSSEGELDDVYMALLMNEFGTLDHLHQFIDKVFVPRMDDWRFIDSLKSGPLDDRAS